MCAEAGDSANRISNCIPDVYSPRSGNECVICKRTPNGGSRINIPAVIKPARCDWWGHLIDPMRFSYLKGFESEAQDNSCSLLVWAFSPITPCLAPTDCFQVL